MPPIGRANSARAFASATRTAGPPVAQPAPCRHPFLKLRGEVLDPAVHGRVIHRDAPVGQHPFEVAVADRKLQVSAHGPEDHLGREAEALGCPGGGGHDGTLGGMLAGASLLTGHAATLNATDPSLPHRFPEAHSRCPDCTDHETDDTECGPGDIDSKHYGVRDALKNAIGPTILGSNGVVFRIVLELMTPSQCNIRLLA